MIRSLMAGDGRSGLMLLFLCLAVPAALGAQQNSQKADSAKAEQPTGPTELVLSREVFTYPSIDRRNPFVPLTGANQGGPRFDQLRLMGIVYYADHPSQSVATLGTSSMTTSTDSTSVSVTPQGKTYYLKIGETAGNVRVVEIHPTMVVVEVDEFGIAQRKIMRMDSRGGNQ